MANETLEVPKTADADSFEEHKANRTAEHKTAEPAPTEKSAVEPLKPPPSEPKAASEPKPDGAREAGDKAEPKKGTADYRVRDALRKEREAREEADRLRKELADARSSQPKPETPPAATVATVEKSKPRLQDFIAALKEGEKYEDAVERHADALLDWKERERADERARVESEQRRKKFVTDYTGKIDAARAKYEDFDSVTAGDMGAGTGLILTPAMQQFVIDSEHGMDAAYYLGQHPDEVKRIGALAPAMQISELAIIARDKFVPPARRTATGTENKPRPVSNAPAPPRTVGGTEPPAAKSTADANNYEEHKRLRASHR